MNYYEYRHLHEAGLKEIRHASDLDQIAPLECHQGPKLLVAKDSWLASSCMRSHIP